MYYPRATHRGRYDTPIVPTVDNAHHEEGASHGSAGTINNEGRSDSSIAPACRVEKTQGRFDREEGNCNQPIVTAFLPSLRIRGRRNNGSCLPVVVKKSKENATRGSAGTTDKTYEAVAAQRRHLPAA